MRSGSQTIPPEASKANSNPTALIIGDASDFRQQCIALFEKAGYDVATAAEAKTAIEALAQRTFGVVLVDCDPVDIDGLRLLDRIKGLAPRTAVILASSAPGVDEAVAAIRQGAADYLVKPVDPERIAAWIQIRENACEAELECEWKRDRTPPGARAFITNDPHVLGLLEAAASVAGTGATILISGESGTGKEVLARHIHQAAGRPDRPFVAVNCAALPETLIESELFGHEKGAFTGAAQRRVGKFEQVGEGTILLDEIGDMPLALQPKILRILQERRIDRLGAAVSREFNGQVIALTNQDLASAVQSGAFREDLYYRLNVVPFRLPPLRARRGDIPLLAR
ncbi:MAG: sigma-54 dependent transcriptional regulator, partial [Desulfobacterales bacterium]